MKKRIWCNNVVVPRGGPFVPIHSPLMLCYLNRSRAPSLQPVSSLATDTWGYVEYIWVHKLSLL